MTFATLNDATSVSNFCIIKKNKKNQSVENAGVAFVKEANERNWFLGKITKL